MEGWSDNFLQGGGEMGELIRNHNWSQTSLGPPQDWPQSLRISVNILLNSQFPMFVWWGEEKLTTIYNDAYKVIAGDKHPLLLGNSGREAWSEIWQDLAPLVNDVFKGNSTWSEDLALNIKRRGFIEETYFTFSYSPILNGTGAVGGLFCAVVETTEKVISKKKLEESEQKLHNVLKQAPNPIFILKGDELVLEVANEALFKFWQVGPEALHKPLLKILPEMEGQVFVDLLRKVLHTGDPFYDYETPAVFKRKNGEEETHYVNFSFQPYREAGGAITGILIIASDVTEQVITKQKLAESETLFGNMVQQAPIPIALTRGHDVVIETVNESMLHMLMKNKLEEVIGKKMIEVLPELEDQAILSIVQNVFHSGVPFSGNEIPIMLNVKGDTRMGFFNVSYTPLKEEGKVTGVLHVALEVTEQVIARHSIETVVEERTKELKDAYRRMEQNNGELKQFAYVASHDLQEPVRKVLTFTQMLEKSLGNVDDRSKTYLGKISSSSKRMLVLIRDVLMFSQLSHERQKFEEVDLWEILQNILNDFELLIEERQAKINCTSLPVITAIPLQMNQLFSNLISNGLKFAKKNEPPVIDILFEVLSSEELAKHPKLNQAAQYYNIMFADNGIGFEQQNADKIFQIFQRLHGRLEYEGTGIGLAICKRIAINHSGDLIATSSESKGAIFNIFLPKEQTNTAEISST